MNKEGCSDAVIDEAEGILPILIRAGYAETDDEAGTWRFTPDGVSRAEMLEHRLSHG